MATEQTRAINVPPVAVVLSCFGDFRHKKPVLHVLQQAQGFTYQLSIESLPINNLCWLGSLCSQKTKALCSQLNPPSKCFL